MQYIAHSGLSTPLNICTIAVADIQNNTINTKHENSKVKHNKHDIMKHTTTIAVADMACYPWAQMLRGKGYDRDGQPRFSGPQKPCWQKPCWQIYVHGLHAYVGARARVAPLGIRRRRCLGKWAFRAPNQELDTSFCCWIAGQRLAEKDCFFTDTGIVALGSNLRGARDRTVRAATP